ncbi:MAG: MerR family transcriptional regulator [Anaerolineae bacterium]|nr:MerR family transcriptional regulator [Anaerolineae bacterium]
MKTYRTSELARAVGIHPNTVRRYEEWGLVPPVPRSANGYRRYTQKHLDCLRLARTVFSAGFASANIRQAGRAIIDRAVADDWGGALEAAYALQVLIQAERAHAEAAASLLERWVQGASADATQQRLRIGQAAALLGVSIDMLRNWERNGLLDVPRDARNGYRLYSAAEISRLRVIRMLSRSGYSITAILRMVIQLDRGETANLRQALDTPRPDDNAYLASDRWLSALEAQAALALKVIALIEDVIRARTAHRHNAT